MTHFREPEFNQPLPKKETFELADQASKRIYERITKQGENNIAIDHFRELTCSLDGEFNAIPDGSSVRLSRVIALEVYSISRIDALETRLAYLFDRSPNLDAITRQSFRRRLDDFVNKVKANAGIHSITHFNESSITIKSRLFSSCKFCLELVGGYLIRIYIHFKPADRLNNLLNAIAEEQYPTRLRLQDHIRGFRKITKAHVDFGNIRKSSALMDLDQSISQDLYAIIGKQILSGIYLDIFKGVPLVHLLSFSASSPSEPSGLNQSTSDPTRFLRLLLCPSPNYNQTEYHSDNGNIFVELRPRKRGGLESYSKFLTCNQNTLFPELTVLPVFAEKEVLWLQASMLCELESAFVRTIHDANISGQRRKRFEIYRLSSIYRIFSRGFDNRIFFKLNDSAALPVSGFNIEIGDNKQLDYCSKGYAEIQSTRKLIDEHLGPLLRACELAKDEASDSFQRWIQVFIVLLSLFAIPLAQIAWERYIDHRFPPQAPPAQLKH